jgi:predicted RNA-binding Zn ribbon-like protein
MTIAPSRVTCQYGDVNHSFPCGDLSLDFVGTLKARRNDAPRETFTTPSSVSSWFDESGLVDSPVSFDDLRDAVELREAVYSVVTSARRHEPLEPDALALVNRAALAAPVQVQLDAGSRRASATASQALSSVARDAIDIVGGPHAALLRECARPECTQVYVDHSRAGRREWCAMETCGNRMKAAAYRARKRAEGE